MKSAHLSVPLVLLAAGLASAGDAPSPTVFPEAPGFASMVAPAVAYDPTSPSCGSTNSGRGLFQSDQAFPNFIGPISNPILSKDPRAVTEARLLFINNEIDPANPLGAGDFQVYAMQLRVALTDRLSLVADKDGYATLHPGLAAARADGWLDINAGLKYALVRDVDNQFLLDAGVTFEPVTGEGKVFQNQGSGVFSAFLTSGKEFGDKAHLLGTFGYQFPTDVSQNSTFFYTSLHLDKQMFGWLYPLVEVNWFYYTSGGDRGLPKALGELDGLINLGTTGMGGRDLVTTAVGLKARLNQHVDTGVAWEVPVSEPHFFLNNRLLAELILRY